jgi:hypothetical protein
MGVEHRAGDSAAARYRPPSGPEREEQPIAAENPRLTRPTHTTKIGLARLNCLSARTVVDRSGRSGRDPNARVAVDADTAAFVRLLIERLRTLG